MPNKADRQVPKNKVPADKVAANEVPADDVPANKAQPYTFSDEVTKRKIRRHIEDINDVITEKDIKNAKVPGAEKVPVPAKPAKKGKKSKDNSVVDDVPGSPATPWDILQE